MPKKVMNMQDVDIVDQAESLPKIVFDESNHAKITTHNGNEYEIKKVSDAVFVNTSQKGGNDNSALSMSALVSASLINPVRSIKEVDESLFDGDLFYLFLVITNYYKNATNFLPALPQN